MRVVVHENGVEMVVGGGLGLFFVDVGNDDDDALHER